MTKKDQLPLTICISTQLAEAFPELFGAENYCTDDNKYGRNRRRLKIYGCVKRNLTKDEKKKVSVKLNQIIAEYNDAAVTYSFISVYITGSLIIHVSVSLRASQ